MKKLTLILLCWLLMGLSLAETTALDDNTLPAFDGCRAVRYRLVEGSLLIDNFGLGPPIVVPIRGSFWLRPIELDPLFWHFAIRRLQFTSGSSVFQYTGRGRGRYKLGGQVAMMQQMTLTASISEVKDLRFDSGLAVVQAPLPWIEIDLTEVFPDPNYVPYRFFQLHLVAVPWPVVWFSTEYGFHASRPDAVTPLYISDGDLLSPTATVIRTNHQLTQRLGIMPIVPDLGLDAVLGLMPALSPSAGPARGEIWFSTEDDAFSESLGELLGDGDLLSEAGRIVRHNADFIKAFSPMPPL